MQSYCETVILGFEATSTYGYITFKGTDKGIDNYYIKGMKYINITFA